MLETLGNGVMLYLVLLPKPPKPETSGSSSLSDLVIVFAVAGIVGALILVAWLLKPMVIRRMNALQAKTDGANNSDVSPATWEAAWAIGGGTGPMPSLILDPPTTRELLTPDTGLEHRYLHGAVITDAELGRPAPPEPEDIVLEQHPSAAPNHEADVHDPNINTETVIGITLTIRELLDYANTGRLRQGFDLYTDSFFRRFQEESGLSGSEFEAAFESSGSPAPVDKTELGAVLDVQPQDEGRVRAVVVYTGSESAPPSEQFTFVRSKDSDRWLIDDISGAE